MSKNRILSAIDIGSSKVTTLIGQLNVEEATGERVLNIVGVAATKARGIKKGQIVNIEEAVEVLIESVEAAERMAGYNLDRAFVSIGGAHISSQNSTGVVAVSSPDSEISQDDVERVVEAARAISLPASREIIHVIPREFVVDGESGVRDPVGMSGVRLEVDTHLITASSPALKNLSKTVQEVGVNIEEIVFNGLASSYSCLTNTEKELGCALVDVGAGTTSVVVYVDGSVSYSGAIPIGARNVTNDLAIGLRVSLDTAEKVKKSLSGTENEKRERGKRENQIEIEAEGEKKKVQKRTLTEGIIRPRLSEIFTMVKLELERVGMANRIPSGVVLTGGGALTYGMADSAKRVLSLPVRVAVPSGVGGLTDDVLEPSFAAPIGLLLYGANRMESSSSFAQSIGRKVKLPEKAVFSRIVETIRDLLP